MSEPAKLFMGTNGATGPLRTTQAEAARGFFNTYPKARTCKVVDVEEGPGELVIMRYRTKAREFTRAEAFHGNED